MTHLLKYFLIASSVWAMPHCAALSDERSDIEFFEKRIRPVLIQSCYECHSGTVDEPKGGLRLDSRDSIRRGGESGPAVVPGNPTDSLLIGAIQYDSFQMPPKNRLPDEVVADFIRWIELGAADPRDEPDAVAAADPWPAILTARRDWWSLQPVTDPPIPATNDVWARTDLDHFILARLTEANLRPAPAASPRRLIRRLSLVLTGLPPRPSAIREYLRDHERNADAAYRALVDRMLESPHFGERWTRHWMDVVRFTETHGNEWNYEVHHAWRYRDYLIRAFNSDVPYDRLVREHLAGDLLETPRWNRSGQFNESVIGTAFYRFGEVNHDDCVTLTSIGYDILDNQIDTLSKAFQATTIACARCHDHKIDAVSMKDYYALLGILKSSRLTAHTIDSAAVNTEPLARLRQLKSEIKTEVAAHWQSQIRLIAPYLAAANAQNSGAGNAAELAEPLDADLLDRWSKTLLTKDPTIDDPIWAWSQMAATSNVERSWSELREKFAETRRMRSESNKQRFTTFADFRDSAPDDWFTSGQGLREGRSSSGEFTVAHEGDNAIASILPAGLFTHIWTQKLNGTLRSPVVPTGAKHLSAFVLGDKTSALRLISNNCQLNYANYRALTSPKPVWVTFKVPEGAQTLSTFAELVTKFDNPKFPDQLGTLGGDRTNDRIPWSEAAADPRSYFGVQRVVLHDVGEPPQPDLAPLSRLFDPSDKVTSREDLAERYARVMGGAVEAWAGGESTDKDVYWLSWILEHGLLDHSLSNRLGDLVGEYRSIEEDQIQRPRLAAGIADAGAGRNHPLLERGNYATPGEAVPRRYLEVLSNGSEPFEPTGSGRRQLANSIASRDNPLTARVMVNRVWHYMFGTGIVRTVDDFGHVGELPSHPALLDHLSTRFTTSMGNGGMGWSIKRLARELAMSQTFRMASLRGAPGLTIDPQNRLLHHYPARRMEAEAIRDSILLVSGRLNDQQFGMSVQPYREEPNETRRLFAGPLDGDGRRSVYIKTNLMEGPKFLNSFNLPGGKVTQGRRDVTNVPAQALAMLNDPFVQQQAAFWASRVLADDRDSAITVRLAKMFEEALGRPPDPSELARFQGLLQSIASQHGVSQQESVTDEAIWKDVAHVLFNLTEFIYIP